MDADPDGWERIDQRKGTALVAVVILAIAGALIALALAVALLVLR